MSDQESASRQPSVVIRHPWVFVRRWPFVTLAIFTLVLGAVWHALGGGARSGVAFTIVSIVGAPFIAAMRWATRGLGMSPPFSQVAGFILGLTPYLIAEVVLRVVRARRLASRR